MEFTELAEEQTIDYLISLPLEELEKRRRIISAQMEVAYKTQNVEAYEKLLKWERHNDMAICEKMFPAQSN